MRPSGNATGAGPIVMIVGPTNVGKTTLARLLVKDYRTGMLQFKTHDMTLV